MKIVAFIAVGAGLVAMSSATSLPAQPSEPPLVGGPTVIGNGVPDGLGAALGRFFVALTVPGTSGAEDVALDLYVTSGPARVDPVTCSEPAQGACEPAGKGAAGVTGYPAVIHEGVMALKLAGAAYLSRGPLRASSLEVALEGSLYAGPESQTGDASDLRLFLANPGNLLHWGADAAVDPVDRKFKNETGAGAVFADSLFTLFPGWLRGAVVENDGAAVYIEFREAQISPVRVGDAIEVWLRPDHEAAAKAGLRTGVFGQIQVNYSGFASPSLIVKDGSSNDTEVHVTAVPAAIGFVRGDCDGSGQLESGVTDALVLLSFNFSGGPEPPCIAACDANADGEAVGTVADAVYLLHFQFAGGPPPPPPFPDCGVGAQPAVLDCNEPLICE